MTERVILRWYEDIKRVTPVHNLISWTLYYYWAAM